MSESPSIQHWLVSVARAAGLPSATDLRIQPDADVDAAWRSATEGTGASEETLAAHVARHYRLDVASLEARDPTAVRLLPASAARRHRVLPLRYSDRTLTVASADPVGMEAEREVAQLSSRNVVLEIAPPGALADAIEAAYPADEGPAHQLPRIPSSEEDGVHVLVVEDDPGTRALLRSTLESRGFHVTEAPDGKDALEVLEMRRVDLVTLDLQMDEMDGVEVLRRMRARVQTATIPVIVATGSDDPEVEMRALEAGADDFVVKPVDPPRFILRIQAVLRRYGATGPTVRIGQDFR